MQPVVEGEWLRAAITNDPDLVILDTTYFLPGETDNGLEQFNQAHIPGARFVRLEWLSDPDASLPNTVPSPSFFAEAVGQLGISNDSTIVVYDQKGLFSAARVWWLFKLFGHDKVSVLEGGLALWRAQGFALEAGGQRTFLRETFTVKPRAGWLLNTEDVISNLDSKKALLIDARGARRFAGTDPEPRPGLRAGHIPGSVNLPYIQVLTDEGKIKSVSALKALFQDVGADINTPVYTTCGSGVTAAITALALTIAGFKFAGLYDGSWSEWGLADHLPIASFA